MKIFIDTEFTDLVDMDLISIGMVSEDGREFYVERNDFNVALCSDFVRQIVLPTLRAPGALVLPRPALQAAVDHWLTQFCNDEPYICYDYPGDWALLWDLCGRHLPLWLKPRNIRENLDMNARTMFFIENGLAMHHALNDARANAAAYCPRKPKWL